MSTDDIKLIKNGVKLKKTEEILKGYYVYLVMKYQNSKTVDTYYDEILKFCVFFEDSLPQSECEFKRYITYIKKEYSSNYCTLKLHAINSFAKFMEVPLDLEFPKRDCRKLPRFVPSHYMFEYLDHIELRDKYDFRNKAMLELMYATGVRVSEVVNLKTADIKFYSNVIRVYGKGRKERVIPFTETSRKYLLVYLKKYRNKFKHYNSKYFFITDQGEQMTTANVRLVVKKYGYKDEHPRYPHQFRHSIATHLLNNGMNIISLAEFLGHSSVTTTQIYTHVDIKSLQLEYVKAFEKKHE